MLQELQHIRIMKFNNDFNRIKPGIDKYIADKRKEDALQSMRYKHAMALTMSKFVSYKGSIDDKLLNEFINIYELLLKES